MLEDKKNFRQVSSKISSAEDPKATKSSLLTKFTHWIVLHNEEDVELFISSLTETILPEKKLDIRKCLYDLSDFQKMLKKPISYYVN